MPAIYQNERVESQFESESESESKTGTGQSEVWELGLSLRLHFNNSANALSSVRWTFTYTKQMTTITIGFSVSPQPALYPSPLRRLEAIAVAGHFVWTASLPLPLPLRVCVICVQRGIEIYVLPAPRQLTVHPSIHPSIQAAHSIDPSTIHTEAFTAFTTRPNERPTSPLIMGRF